MNYQRVQKLPKYVNSQVVKGRGLKPQAPNHAYPGIDIISLYQRQQAGSETKGRRQDSDQRAKYIKETKERLGLNEKTLGLSSRRSVHDGNLRFDYPHLEFDQYFERLQGVHLFKPHEMQWSLDQFLERMIDTKEEADSRIENMMESRYDEINKFIKRADEINDEEELNKKDEALRQQLKDLNFNTDIELETSAKDKTRIF